MDILDSICHHNLRPTVDENCFGEDPRMETVKTLLTACLSHIPSARPSAAECHDQLAELLHLSERLGTESSSKESSIELLSTVELSEFPQRALVKWCTCHLPGMEVLLLP